jgi:hypothetical protein
MARTRTTKAVAQRIDLNYFKRATPFKRAKLWLAVLGPAVALVWIGWHSFAGDHRVYSSGRLGPAHAVLEKQCEACHVRNAGGFLASAADSACLRCHDGPEHHPINPDRLGAQEDAKFSCAECHVEHRGQVHLAGLSGQACARCHGDGRAGTASTKFGSRIRGLADGHPEFRVLRPPDSALPHDPGTIKLNHALHMKAIQRGPNGPMVQLECSDCHRPSLTADALWVYGDKSYAAATVSYTAAETFEPGGSRGLATKKPWSDRQLMAPVKFATACAGCHSLAFDKRFEEGVPHDRPDVVHAFLVKKFSDYIMAHPAEVREVQNPGRNLAGREANLLRRTVSASQWVTDRVVVAEELLWHKSCAQCHAISGARFEDVRIARWDAAGAPRETVHVATGAAVRNETTLPTIAAAHITLQWLPHARFDHDAHTGFSCAACHANALGSAVSSDLLIPGIAVCQACHADGPGHASAQCAECHTYHDWSKRKEVKPVFMLPGLKSGGN